jgi:hypothetical protein
MRPAARPFSRSEAHVSLKSLFGKLMMGRRTASAQGSEERHLARPVSSGGKGADVARHEAGHVGQSCNPGQCTPGQCTRFDHFHLSGEGAA